MTEATHYLDFLERLEQLTEMEAVKEAYLAYVSSMFDSYKVFKTPASLVQAEVRLIDCTHPGVSRSQISPFECGLHDELILIVGPRGSFGSEHTRWLEIPRAAVRDRLEKLLLSPPVGRVAGVAGQGALLEALRNLTAGESEPWVGMLVEVGDGSGLDAVLRSSLPPGTSAYHFTNSILAAVIPKCDDLRSRWLAHKAMTAIREALHVLEVEGRSYGSVACWPTDADTTPLFLLALQQGLQDAGRLSGLPRSSDLTVVFASDWVAKGSGDEPGDDGTAGAPVRVTSPNPDLRGGAAMRMDDEQP